MVRWLREQGLEAGSFRTEYGDEALDEAASAAPEDAPEPAAGTA
jgi:putative mRNA 3-end processing factor